MSPENLLFHIAEWTIVASINPMIPLFIIGLLIIPSCIFWDKLRLREKSSRRQRHPLSTRASSIGD
jgi:hypothetical protein